MSKAYRIIFIDGNATYIKLLLCLPVIIAPQHTRVSIYEFEKRKIDASTYDFVLTYEFFYRKPSLNQLLILHVIVQFSMSLQRTFYRFTINTLSQLFL